ncbi:POTRA domain-containing protein [Klebsiella grimontii]|nr:POTRA domain-containing protein [Klebsiella grimontii]
MLRHSTSAPSLPEAPPSEPDGQCFQLRYIRLENVTVLPRSAVRKLTTIPLQGCMTLPDIRERVRDVTQDYLSRGFITSRAWLPEQGYFRRNAGHCRHRREGGSRHAGGA